MITELLLIAAAGIYDPMDMSGHQMYPSGIKEMDKYPRYELPQSKLAKLALPRSIFDKNGSLIKSGHYLAGLSITRRELLIFDGEEEIFSLDVTKTMLLEKPFRFATVELKVATPDEAYLILTQNKYRVYAKVKLGD